MMTYKKVDRTGWMIAKKVFMLMRWLVVYLFIHVMWAYILNEGYSEDMETQMAAMFTLLTIYMLLHLANYLIINAIDSDVSGDTRAKVNIGMVLAGILFLLVSFYRYCAPGEYAAYKRNDKAMLESIEAAREEAESQKEREMYLSRVESTTASRETNVAPSSTRTYTAPSTCGPSRSTGRKNLNPYEAYDKGYDSIYYDGEYDEDRYEWDWEYADGVDDAMDELDEDG